MTSYRIVNSIHDELLAAGTITPHIAARLPLTEASQALRLAGARAAHGKVVLLPVTAPAPAPA